MARAMLLLDSQGYYTPLYTTAERAKHRLALLFSFTNNAFSRRTNSIISMR